MSTTKTRRSLSLLAAFAVAAGALALPAAASQAPPTFGLAATTERAPSLVDLDAAKTGSITIHKLVKQDDNGTKEGNGLVDTLWHLALPSIALATGIGAMLVRITRAAVGAELSQDYVTFARSRGVPHRRITAMYVRGAALPIITSAGLILGTLFGSTVLVEEAFSLPGLGQLLADSITYKDVPVVQAIALLVAFVIIAVTLVVDVAAFAVDPRQTIGEGRGA